VELGQRIGDDFIVKGLKAGEQLLRRKLLIDSKASFSRTSDHSFRSTRCCAASAINALSERRFNFGAEPPNKGSNVSA